MIVKCEGLMGQRLDTGKVAMQVIEVAAGIIAHEGRYLIARRKAGAHLGGLWEFPGGKRETGETLEECLHREYGRSCRFESAH